MAFVLNISVHVISYRIESLCLNAVLFFFITPRKKYDMASNELDTQRISQKPVLSQPRRLVLLEYNSWTSAWPSSNMRDCST